METYLNESVESSTAVIFLHYQSHNLVLFKIPLTE
jgi:hypothetical protein